MMTTMLIMNFYLTWIICLVLHTAGGTAGIEVDGCGLPAWRAENSESHLTAERQGSRGTVENEKRLPHTAIVGRRDKRSENAKVQGG